MRDENLVYEMRPATDEDGPVVHELLRARNDWARQRGLLLPDSIALRVLIGNDGDNMALMLLAEDNAVVGCFILYATTPGWTWTVGERAEPSMSLAMMHTHPDQHGARLADLMTLWVLDYAARRTGPELQWVRCSVPDNQLSRYFREELGWHQVRVARNAQGQRHAQMQRRPQRLPELSALVRSTDPTLLVTGDLAITTAPVVPRQPRQSPGIVTSGQGGGRS